LYKVPGTKYQVGIGVRSIKLLLDDLASTSCRVLSTEAKKPHRHIGLFHVSMWLEKAS